jgi:thiosulfate reductase cytochrome b subunit
MLMCSAHTSAALSLQARPQCLSGLRASAQAKLRIIVSTLSHSAKLLCIAETCLRFRFASWLRQPGSLASALQLHARVSC